MQAEYLAGVDDAPDLDAYCFEKDEEVNPHKILNCIFISESRDKKLKDTKSRSSNILLKIHFLLRGKKLDAATK